MKLNLILRKDKKLLVSLLLFASLFSKLIFAQKVQAVNFDLPSSFTKKNLIKWKFHRNSKITTKLKNASLQGIYQNKYIDDNPADQRTIDLKHLNKQDKQMLSKFSLALINQGRDQIGSAKWIYNKHAQKFADRVAKQYTTHQRSIYDATHYLAGIKRAAKQSGLNDKIGQVYEDEAGFPYTSQTTSLITVRQAKENIYLNYKQMIFGGFVSKQKQYTHITEWDHAYDLLNGGKRDYALSFSFLPQPQYISSHWISVNHDCIVNSKYFK